MRLTKFSKTLALLITTLIASLVLAACGSNVTNTPVPVATATATVAPTTAPATTAPATAAPTVAATTPAKAGTTPTSNTTPGSNPTKTVVIPTPTRNAVTPVATPTPLATSAVGKLPRFEAGKCQFALEKGLVEGKDVKCGYVIVPEERRDPKNTRVLRIAVAYYPNPSATPDSVPVILLAGGPGQDVLTAPDLNNRLTARLLAPKNDFIFFDQRGSGLSEPNTDCGDLLRKGESRVTKALNVEEDTILASAFILKCRDELLAKKVNLNALNSIENAADVDDIREALGFKQLNLLGISYGTRLALTVERDFPQGVRSVLIDSVLLPQSNQLTDAVVGFDLSLNQLFDQCAKDAACNKAYPDLKNVFSKIYNQLNAKPVQVNYDFGSGPVPVQVNGFRFLQGLHQFLYSADNLPYLPALLYLLAKGDYSVLKVLEGATGIINGGNSTGMFFSIVCNDEAGLRNKDRYQAVLKATSLPELREGFFAGSLFFEVCGRWSTRAVDPKDARAVASDIPTLIFEGQFDPITPPVNGQTAAKSLTKSFYVQLPGFGHSVVTASECAIGIYQNFLQNPTTKPDSSCTSKMTFAFK